MMLFGKRINADTALEWGLVNRMAPHKEVVGCSVAIAKELIKVPPLAVKALKDCMQFWSKNGTRKEGLELETERFTVLLHEKLTKPDTK